MKWLRRLLGAPVDRWPTRTPPTVAGDDRPVFHCPRCRTPVADAATSCPSCGERLP